MQPLLISTSFSSERDSAAPAASTLRSITCGSMFTSLMSLAITATRRPSPLARMGLSNVVLPAPTKPDRAVTGNRGGRMSVGLRASDRRQLLFVMIKQYQVRRSVSGSLQAWNGTSAGVTSAMPLHRPSARCCHRKCWTPRNKRCRGRALPPATATSKCWWRKASFELMGHQYQHHHFQCRKCERVFDVHACPGDLSGLAPHGFTVEEHCFPLYGRCKDCGPPALGVLGHLAYAQVVEHALTQRRDGGSQGIHGPAPVDERGGSPRSTTSQNQRDY